MKILAYGGKPIRNLLMHIYPVRGSVWRWNVAEVLKRISQFDGQKVISVVTDSKTDALADVKSAFCGTVQDFLNFPNDPTLGEGVSFEPLMRRVENIDPRQVVYYCHAKGTKYLSNNVPTSTRADGSHEASGKAVLVQVRRWAETMHASCLDYPGIAEDALRDHTFAGTFLKNGQFPGLPRAWHFAGTFFWFRSAYVFGGDWKRLARHWWGVEAWPGTVAPRDQAVCLLHEGDAPHMRMYERGYWAKNIDQPWRQWQQDHSPLKRAIPYVDLLPHLRLNSIHRIIVTGAQRSGTQVASRILAHDLKLPFIEEREFGTHDLPRFMALVNQRARYVVHAPAMAHVAHQLPGCVVWLRRDLADVIRSQRRVDWQEHGIHHGQRERDKYFNGDDEPSASIKSRAWSQHQAIVLGGRGLELEYESLKGHSLWVESDGRRDFGERQTGQAVPVSPYEEVICGIVLGTIADEFLFVKVDGKPVGFDVPRHCPITLNGNPVNLGQLRPGFKACVTVKEHHPSRALKVEATS